MTETFTMYGQLCDENGLISDEYAPASTMALGQHVTYRQVLNNLRAATSLPPYTGPALTCTGSAHLAGQHIKCTNPLHHTEFIILSGKPAPRRAVEILIRRGKAQPRRKMITARVTCAMKYEQDTGVARSTVVTFGPDYADGRNKEWASATPYLNLTMTLKGPVADQFVTGHKYTLEFTETESN